MELNIKLPTLGNALDFYNIGEYLLKLKKLKNMSRETIITITECIDVLLKLESGYSSTFKDKFKFIINSENVSNRLVSPDLYPYRTRRARQNNNFTSEYDIITNPNKNIPNGKRIPVFYRTVLITYNGLDNPIYNNRSYIKSSGELLITIAKICNHILTLCKRKKIDCNNLQCALKIILINCDNSLEYFTKTINSLGNVMTSGNMKNIIINNELVKNTVSTFNNSLNPGLALTPEATIYLVLFMLSLDPTITEPHTILIK